MEVGRINLGRRSFDWQLEFLVFFLSVKSDRRTTIPQSIFPKCIWLKS